MSEPNVVKLPPSNKVFLQAVFGEHWASAYIVSFPEDPNTPGASKWIARRWTELRPAQLEAVQSGAWNNYFCISRFGDRGRKSSGAPGNFIACHCVVLDDVGVKVQAHEAIERFGHPTWRIETSRGNEQWGYRLATPETDERRADRLLKKLVQLGLTDPSCGDVSRLVRLPVGTNTKEAAGRWRSVLRAWEG